MSDQDITGNILSPTPVPPLPEHDLAGYLARYQQALATFEHDPKELLSALIARDRIDTELHRWAGASDVPLALDPDLYRRQCASLIERIGRRHPSYLDVLIFQHRLLENLDQVERYGDTENLRAERIRVIDRLNSLALAALGVPFTDFAPETQAPATTVPDDTSGQLVALDGRLRQLAFRRFHALADLLAWRSSFNPPETAWWWRLDTQFESTEQERDLLWYLGAALCTIFSLTISVEIIRRLWSGTSDAIAVFGTILTLLLTSSPLLKRGPELGQWAIRHLTWLNPREGGEATFGMAALALILVLLGWFSLPSLGTLYNNWGDEALNSGDLVTAEQWFQRATALKPELPVAYYNLAVLYEDSGSPDEAIRWYRTSIERDRRFRLAYVGLGSLYNRQGKYDQAEQVLLSGLNIENPGEDQALATYADYMLLSNLGWALVAQSRFGRAEEILREALERERLVDENVRSKLPHYYLARVHCAFQHPKAAVQEIQETLRFGNPQRWEHRIWTATVNDYLATVQRGTPACAAIPAFTPSVSAELPRTRDIP
jgi:tetratricopeptide (TPR) repeat protein